MKSNKVDNSGQDESADTHNDMRQMAIGLFWGVCLSILIWIVVAYLVVR